MAEFQLQSATGKLPSIDLARMIDTYGDRLLRSACLLCGDSIEARDLVQQTFLQAHMSAAGFRGDSAVYTWLYGILLHLCHRHFRRQNRWLLQAEPIAGETVRTDPGGAMDQNYRATQLQAIKASPTPLALGGRSPGPRDLP